MANLRWGIIGTGNIAKQFAEGVAFADRGEVTAVASRSKEAADDFALRFRIDAALAGYDEILKRDDVDAIYLSLPNRMHHEWAIKALHAGKHVLCEKPIALDERETIEMYDAARAMDRRLIEAFMYRCHPQTAKLMETIRSGAIGEVKLIRSSFCYRVRTWQGNIRFSHELAGGALMDVGCYCVSIGRLIAGGDPVDVRATARMFETGVDEQTTVALRYGNGVTHEFTCGMMTQADNTLHVCGDEGYITVAWPWKPAPPGTSFEVRSSIPPRQDPSAAKPQAGPRTIDVPNTKPLYAIEADAFAAAVLDGAEPFVSESESLGNMRTLDRIRAAIDLHF